MSEDTPPPSAGQPGEPDQAGSTPPPPPPPPPQQPVFNPQSGYPSGDPAAPPPYPPAAPPSNPYAAQQPYPPQGYPPAPGHPGMPQFPTYVLPDHPKATSALVVGLIAVAGTFFCGLPVLASPVAWVLGVQARRQIRAAPQQWGGEGKATAGMILGIIGTVLLVLAILVIAVIIIVAISDPSAFDSDTSV